MFLLKTNLKKVKRFKKLLPDLLYLLPLFKKKLSFIENNIEKINRNLSKLIIL